MLDYYRGGELFFHLKKQRRFTEEVARKSAFTSLSSLVLKHASAFLLNSQGPPVCPGIYVLEIALALGHLHSKNVIYRYVWPAHQHSSGADLVCAMLWCRDLKTENILLDDQGLSSWGSWGLYADSLLQGTVV